MLGFRWKAFLPAAVALLSLAAMPRSISAKEPNTAKPAKGAAGQSAAPDLRWLAADGTPSWSLDLAPPKEGTQLATLSTTPKFPAFPAVEFQLLDGGQAKTEDFAGRVLLVDFWASWCKPCIEELPHLQKLYDTEREKGLAAIAVNTDEPLDAVRKGVAKLGLTLPVGIYDNKYQDLFDVQTLPTLILVDRQGRIRDRWNGYGKGLERTVAERVRVLLGDDVEGRSREIARVADGAGRFEIAWVAEMKAAVSGLASLGFGRPDAINVVAAAGDQLALIGATGNVERRLKLPSSAWRLAAPPQQTKGAEPDLLAFRWGANEIVSIDLDQSLVRGWNAPGPIFGLAFTPPARAGEGQAVWVATLEGVGRADLSGFQFQRVGEPEPYLSAAPGPSSSISALTRDGKVRRLESSGVVGTAVSVSDEARQLVGLPDATGVGVLTESVTASAVGKYLGGDSRQTAIATSDGVLAIADIASGRVLFRAQWPGVVALATADLDDDGQDELLVGSGRLVVGLRARRAEPGTGS